MSSAVLKKKHLIEVAPFGRLDQNAAGNCLGEVSGGSLPPQTTSPLNGRPQHLIEAAKRGHLDRLNVFFFGTADDTGAADDRPAGRPLLDTRPDVRLDVWPNARPVVRLRGRH